MGIVTGMDVHYPRAGERTPDLFREAVGRIVRDVDAFAVDFHASLVDLACQATRDGGALTDGQVVRAMARALRDNLDAEFLDARVNDILALIREPD